MLAELRSKSQVTIPKEIIKRLGLSEGDRLEISERDGAIHLVPVAVYPQSVIAELKASVNKIKASIASGKQPLFDSIDQLFDDLEKQE